RECKVAFPLDREDPRDTKPRHAPATLWAISHNLQRRSIDPTYCCRGGGLVVEKLYRAIFHAPSASFLRMKSSWFASALFAPAALTVTVPAELVRANAQSGATWTTSATVNFRFSLIALNTASYACRTAAAPTAGWLEGGINT